jgi:glucose/arabinose dehydrogenase
MGVADEPEALTSNLRAAWATSRVHGSPDPPSPYRTKVAFPHLKFDEPDAMTFVPGTSRMVIVQRFGKIYTFENSRDANQLHLLMDLPKVLGVERVEVFGIAFHPRFEENRQFFIHYNRGGVELPTRVARFEVRNDNRWQADPESHTLLISWPNGHNGGCLKFGPDDYLYISNGDQGGFHDSDEVGQGLNDLQASILRIDVDGTDGVRPYRIPADNPFLDIPDARHEVWAFGLRNPWKCQLSDDRFPVAVFVVNRMVSAQIHAKCTFFVTACGCNYGGAICLR